MKKILITILAVLLLSSASFAGTSQTQEQVNKRIELLQLQIKHSQEALDLIYPDSERLYDHGTRHVAITAAAITLATFIIGNYVMRNPALKEVIDISRRSVLFKTFVASAATAGVSGILQLLYDMTDEEEEFLQADLDRLYNELETARKALNTSIEDL